MRQPELAIELARALAAYAHEGQLDKAGQPYLSHPVAVAEKVHTPEEKVTALLHDVLEDTFVLPETIENLFGAVILTAVQAVTKMPGESYFDFVARAKQNLIARVVKLADLEHNMDLSRIPKPTGEDLARLEKYRKAKAFLMED